ncbi:hypothetical protein D3C85_1255400 [compost metagenome]
MLWVESVSSNTREVYGINSTTWPIRPRASSTGWPSTTPSRSPLLMMIRCVKGLGSTPISSATSTFSFTSADELSNSRSRTFCSVRAASFCMRPCSSRFSVLSFSFSATSSVRLPNWLLTPCHNRSGRSVTQ